MKTMHSLTQTERKTFGTNHQCCSAERLQRWSDLSQLTVRIAVENAAINTYITSSNGITKNKKRRRKISAKKSSTVELPANRTSNTYTIRIFAIQQSCGGPMHCHHIDCSRIQNQWNILFRSLLYLQNWWHHGSIAFTCTTFHPFDEEKNQRMINESSAHIKTTTLVK